MDINKNLQTLMAKRAEKMAAATAAREAGNTAECDAIIAEIKGLNAQIDSEKEYIVEAQRFADEEAAAKAAEGFKSAETEERGASLMKGASVNYGVDELRRALKSTTLATTSIAKPTEVGGVHGTNIISSIIDQVRVIDLSGCGQINEAYVVSDMEAQAGTVAATAGVARTASDPTFAYAAIKPYEVSITSYIDRNMGKLTPVSYEQRVREMAMSSMRAKVNSLIVNGDGQASPDMFGCVNAKNTAGAAIFDTLNVTSTTLTPDNLVDLVFAYGGNEALGGNGRLYLNKADLAVIGKMRGTNEKKALFQITPDGNGNTGMISDGGLFIPYTISNDVAALSTATRGAKDIPTMFFGDPQNYELGLFGAMTVRIDESVKAVERMNAILGDAMVGGNLIVHKGVVALTLQHT